LLTLYLVRHGETAWNAQSRLQGQTDIPLSDNGRQQARLLGAHWAAGIPPHFAACYASDLDRARETAQILLDALPGSTPVLQTDTRLRERNFGVWEGLTPHERAVKFGEVDTRDCPEGGEFWEDVWARMLSFLEMLWEKYNTQDASVLVVGHGGSLRCWLAYADGLGAEDLRRYQLPNTSLSIITLQGNFTDSLEITQKRILLRTDTTHLTPC
jgi:2,3-bisphosphoglycerate-dependent phosphoglycerate mutase